MSATPETDAAIYPMNGVDIVWPEFARKLERERDEARSELSLKQQTLTIAEGTLSDLRKQRDEWAAMCGRYKQERDEARAVAAAMADIAFKHLRSLLASTPHSKDAAHEEETQQVIAAIKKWKELKQ